MNIHGTFCGPMMPTFIWKVRLTRTIAVFFFEKNSAAGPVTCTFTRQRYTSLLGLSVILALKVKRWDTTPAFIQDVVSPHIARCVKQVLCYNFDDYRILSRHFPTSWTSR
ncbi:hypothetical protein TNCV_3795531 [Trichonephila clavipes]|nr:hypothetical protein TNCV_3795531 [Trichonephila clavipes]